MRKRKEKRWLEAGMTILILAGSFYIGQLGAQMTEIHNVYDTIAVSQIAGVSDVETPDGEAEDTEQTEQTEKFVPQEGIVVNHMELEQTENEFQDMADARVVIDAGHGGFDSGKVGMNGILEKDINLAIALKVNKILTKKGIEVIMTRDNDKGLYKEEEDNKKQQDMKERCRKINESGADLVVSIHQNSYTEEYVYGPQVFFYTTSEKGKAFAGIMQNRLNEKLQIEKKREIKPNNMYYILRKTSLPIIIVECGFLSNAQEAEKLTEEEYQIKVANAICDGIIEFMRQTSVLR